VGSERWLPRASWQLAASQMASASKKRVGSPKVIPLDIVSWSCRWIRDRRRARSLAQATVIVGPMHISSTPVRKARSRTLPSRLHQCLEAIVDGVPGI